MEKCIIPGIAGQARNDEQWVLNSNKIIKERPERAHAHFIAALCPSVRGHMNKQEFIDFMAGAGVLTFGDFTTKSGRKTPYFVNTGNYKTGMHISMLGDYYSDCIVNSGEQFNALFGPAYKGITLAAATAGSLYRNHGIDIPYFFNRKEIKDHGEGGAIVGYIPQNGDKIIIIEDVVTAGTAVRESLELLKAVAEITVTALFVSVDRMERGTGERSTLDELRDEFGINVYSIITVRDIIDSFPHCDERVAKMEEYLVRYGTVTLAGKGNY